MKGRLSYCALALVIVALGGESTFAQTSDTETPAVEAVCDEVELGGALRGLCNAYCEALDCDGSPNASVISCAAVQDRFLNISGGIEIPCLAPPGLDTDGDGVLDDIDNCAFTPNDQTDSDGDGVGDACDNCVLTGNADQDDLDDDLVGNACDNCVLTANPDQADYDSNGVGDACEMDSDADGIPEWGFEGIDCTGGETFQCEDNCPLIYNPDQSDSDSDSVGDVCDNCPAIYNLDQTDSDSDGVGDVCDANP